MSSASQTNSSIMQSKLRGLPLRILNGGLRNIHPLH